MYLRPSRNFSGSCGTAGTGTFSKAAAIEQRDKPGLGAHAHVIARTGHDELVRLQVFVEDHLAALRALDPEIVGHFALRR